MNVFERSAIIADAACRYAEECWVAVTTTGVIVLAHPGGDTSHLDDLEYLRNHYGVQSLDCVMRMSDPRCPEAPVPFSADNVIARAQRELDDLHVGMAFRDEVDVRVIAEAEARVAQVVADLSDA